MRCVGGPARLLRFPLAFLEAFPGYFLPPHLSPATTTATATAAAGTAAPAYPERGSGDGAENGPATVSGAGSEAVEGYGGVLAPGLWRRAVVAVMFSPGGDGASGGGGGGVGATVVSDRFKVVCLGEGGGGGSSAGGIRGDGVQEKGRCDGGFPGKGGRGRDRAVCDKRVMRWRGGGSSQLGVSRGMKRLHV